MPGRRVQASSAFWWISRRLRSTDRLELNRYHVPRFHSQRAEVHLCFSQPLESTLLSKLVEVRDPKFLVLERASACSGSSAC